MRAPKFQSYDEAVNPKRKRLKIYLVNKNVKRWEKKENKRKGIEVSDLTITEKKM